MLAEPVEAGRDKPALDFEKMGYSYQDLEM